MTLLKDTRVKKHIPAGVVSFPARRIARDGQVTEEKETVAREMPLTIVLNDRELVTLLCYPVDIKSLAVGFLASEGFIVSKEEIRLVTVDDKRGVARVITRTEKETDPDVIFKRVISSGCGRGASFYSAADTASLKVASDLSVPAGAVFDLADEFQHRSSLYLQTHAVHSAALCEEGRIVIFAEDIGRHNAIDKIFGRCLLEDVPAADRIIITSGRITSEIMHKIARRNIPVLISISSPTDLGIRIADTLGITLVAAVRGKKMNVYTHAYRIVP